MEKETLIQKGGRAQLENRAKRLLKLLELGAPTLILCEEAALVFRAACSIDPELAGGALAKALRDNHAREKRICLHCFDAEIFADGIEICDECEEEMHREEAEDEDEDESKSESEHDNERRS